MNSHGSEPFDSQAPPSVADPEVFDRLIELIRPAMMIAIASQRLGTKLRGQIGPDDLWQETLLTAWRDRGTFVWQGLPSFRRWIITILEHRILDAQKHARTDRQGGRNVLVHLDAELLRQCPLVSTTPSRTAVHREEASVLIAAYEGLEEDVREVVWLRLFEDVPTEEIAQKTNLPLTTVKHRLRRGVVTFQQRVQAALRQK